MVKSIFLAALLLLNANFRGAQADWNQAPPTIRVANAKMLQAAFRDAVPGTRIEIAPGDYGSVTGTNLRGRAGKTIIVTASDASDPPRFVSLQLSRCEYLELSDLVFAGAPDNGLNVDDGGDYAWPAHHIVLRRLQVRDVGPDGNHDGVKLSGLDDFQVLDCTIERWGTGNGSGIDMVGCHRGLIRDNVLRHQQPTPENGSLTGAHGVQTKGGCRAIRIENNRFEHAGARAINCGGSTGQQFFRPPLETLPNGAPRSEASEISIVGNVIIGSEAALAFVGVDGALVQWNTIYLPRKWALRILQETRAPGFVTSRDVKFFDNLVVFSQAEWSEGGVNIGAATTPEKFTFAHNFWFCLDDPAHSRPTLPTVETDGVFGENPLFVAAQDLDLRLQADSPARDFGATAAKEILKK